ncbi:hypothetical protein OROGR_011980 [Orobanche gracilis]
MNLHKDGGTRISFPICCGRLHPTKCYEIDVISGFSGLETFTQLRYNDIYIKCMRNLKHGIFPTAAPNRPLSMTWSDFSILRLTNSESHDGSDCIDFLVRNWDCYIVGLRWVVGNTPVKWAVFNGFKLPTALKPEDTEFLDIKCSYHDRHTIKFPSGDRMLVELWETLFYSSTKAKDLRMILNKFFVVFAESLRFAPVLKDIYGIMKKETGQSAMLQDESWELICDWSIVTKEINDWVDPKDADGIKSLNKRLEKYRMNYKQIMELRWVMVLLT